MDTPHLTVVVAGIPHSGVQAIGRRYFASVYVCLRKDFNVTKNTLFQSFSSEAASRDGS